MYKGKKVSLVMPAYNEEDSVVRAINEVYKLKIYDEIIIVDNNSRDATSPLAKKTKKAKVVYEKRQGYGSALIKGISIAKGEIIVMCDCDNSYNPKEVMKLLRFSEKFDFVFTSRTQTRANITASNMKGLRRWSNIFVGRTIQVLFKGPKMTDPGATFRLLNRASLMKIYPFLSIKCGHFQPELTCLALLNDILIKEVPVHYYQRTGISKISGTFLGGFKTGKNMFKVILYYRLTSWLAKILK